MTVKMKEVFSSHVDQIGYDDQSRELIVKWDTGKTSVYSGVPANVASTVINSWSIGTALRDMVKGKYPHRYAL